MASSPRDAHGASINLGVVIAARFTVRLEHKFYNLDRRLGFDPLAVGAVRPVCGSPFTAGLAIDSYGRSRHGAVARSSRADPVGPPKSDRLWSQAPPTPRPRPECSVGLGR